MIDESYDEPLKESSCSWTFVASIMLIILCIFLLGAKVGKETTESDMYHRDYQECIKELPRNVDCVAVKVQFKEVKRGL